ncbi:MAG TPA: cupin domain-containing protein [Thermoleophilaceae bacterium]|jgi:mannose-6-phosphate isomerase-like protein (cupin superfamily)|nr:cupin domain-containing protein [Thermoleophilaceae bacterium]
MTDFRVVKIDDMEAIAFGTFRRARAELDVTAFGLQILDLPPNLDAYPEHDHAEDGQEEVYFVLRGTGEVEIEGERIPIDPDTAVSIKAGTRRKLWPGPDGLRVIAIGGKPGAIYEGKDFSELGAPDPFAQLA